MTRLDHLTIRVSNYMVSRDWYTGNFGLHVEFENLAVGFGGLEDDGAVELILVQQDVPPGSRDCSLTFQCENVHTKYAELSARGVTLVHGPKTVPWGFGAELLDPDGYRVMLWDKHTMPGYKEK